MTRRLQIASLAEEAARRTGTRDPFEYCEKEGIRVVCCPDFQNLKGMYKVILDERFIFLNGHLHRREAREVLAHEIGHDALHREMARDSVVQDHFLVDMTLKPEYEANLFAASLLLSDERVLSLFREGKTTEEAASLLKTSPYLVNLKAQILADRGELPAR